MLTLLFRLATLTIPLLLLATATFWVLFLGVAAVQSFSVPSLQIAERSLVTASIFGAVTVVAAGSAQMASIRWLTANLVGLLVASISALLVAVSLWVAGPRVDPFIELFAIYMVLFGVLSVSLDGCQRWSNWRKRQRATAAYDADDLDHRAELKANFWRTRKRSPDENK